VSEGDIDANEFGSIVEHWWQVDDSGLQSIAAPEFPEDDVPCNCDSCPMIRFFIRRNQILIGERFGALLIARKVGVISIPNDSDIKIDHVTTVWSSAKGWRGPRQGNDYFVKVDDYRFTPFS
jgi:hypothetical protein